MKLQFNLHKKYRAYEFLLLLYCRTCNDERLIDGLNLVMRFTSTAYDIVVHLYSVTPWYERSFATGIFKIFIIDIV